MVQARVDRPVPCPSKATFRERRLSELRRRFVDQADPEHAVFHRGYHKSSLDFYGLKTKLLDAAFRAVFPPRKPVERDDCLPLVRALWESAWFEERMAGLALLCRLRASLGPGDLSWLRQVSRECEGWAQLDRLATEVLGRMALAHGEAVYRPVRLWSRDPVMWTRRASILIHIRPARERALAHAHAFATFEELLAERDFFIRKAIGWTLREASKHYPTEVHAFLLRVGDGASGLTRREGARRLPAPLRAEILGG